MVSVLHVTQPTSGGVARAVVGLVKAQVADGLDVAVASPAGELPEMLSAVGALWQPWESARQPGSGLKAEMKALGDIVEARQPDLVHLHSSKAGLVGRLVLRGRRPTAFQPHAWSFLAARGKTRSAAIRWERYATRWTDLTLFCSRREQRDGEAHGISGQGRVVLNGVDLQQFSIPSQAERAAAKAALSLPQDAMVAAVVGRKSVQKGQDVALRAWPTVRQAVPSAVLMLMGEGYEDAYDSAAGVLTCAARSNVRPAYVAADVLLSPSRWEGLSLSLLEGMATARPTVATDVAGSVEALIEGSLPPAGAVVRPDDAEGLAAAVVARFQAPDLASREGVTARRRVEQRFDETKTTGSVYEAYRLLLRDSRNRVGLVRI